MDTVNLLMTKEERERKKAVSYFDLLTKISIEKIWRRLSMSQWKVVVIK